MDELNLDKLKEVWARMEEAEALAFPWRAWARRHPVRLEITEWIDRIYVLAPLPNDPDPAYVVLMPTYLLQAARVQFAAAATSVADRDLAAYIAYLSVPLPEPGDRGPSRWDIGIDPLPPRPQTPEGS